MFEPTINTPEVFLNEDFIAKKGDSVFYQTNNEKAWLVSAKLTDIDKNWVYSP